MLTHPLLHGRSRGSDAVHEDSGVTDGQSDCRCGFWISDSRAGAGKWAGVEDHRGIEAYKYAYHLVFLGGVPLAVAGVVLWGIGMGWQESIMRSVVADLTPKERRASAFGLFNTGFGILWFGAAP
jgi:hypothetical protein